jgi:hypothetical protein
MHDILYSPLFQTLTNCINGLGTYSDPYLDDLEMTLFQPQTRGGVLEIEGHIACFHRVSLISKVHCNIPKLGMSLIVEWDIHEMIKPCYF